MKRDNGCIIYIVNNELKEEYYFLSSIEFQKEFNKEKIEI